MTTPPAVPNWPEIEELTRVLKEEYRALPPGTRLPTQVKTKEKHGVSWNTFLRVHRALIAEKVIVSSRGQGIFTAEQLPPAPPMPPVVAFQTMYLVICACRVCGATLDQRFEYEPRIADKRAVFSRLGWLCFSDGNICPHCRLG